MGRLGGYRWLRRHVLAADVSGSRPRRGSRRDRYRSVRDTWRRTHSRRDRFCSRTRPSWTQSARKATARIATMLFGGVESHASPFRRDSDCVRPLRVLERRAKDASRSRKGCDCTLADPTRRARRRVCVSLRRKRRAVPRACTVGIVRTPLLRVGVFLDRDGSVHEERTRRDPPRDARAG
jgi:hypothetical protein